MKKLEYLETLEGMINYIQKKVASELDRDDLTEEDLIDIERDIDILGKVITHRNRLVLSLKNEKAK